MYNSLYSGEGYNINQEIIAEQKDITFLKFNTFQRIFEKKAFAPNLLLSIDQYIVYCNRSKYIVVSSFTIY